MLFVVLLYCCYHLPQKLCQEIFFVFEVFPLIIFYLKIINYLKCIIKSPSSFVFHPVYRDIHIHSIFHLSEISYSTKKNIEALLNQNGFLKHLHEAVRKKLIYRKEVKSYSKRRVCTLKDQGRKDFHEILKLFQIVNLSS